MPSLWPLGQVRVGKMRVDRMQVDHGRNMVGYTHHLPGGVVLAVQCSDGCLVNAPLFPILAEGEVYSWGKGTRGRLGRRDEDAGLPRPVQLDETHPYMVTSVSCCHGNTLLAVRCEFSSPISPTSLG